MKTKFVLIGAFTLSILAAILLTVGPGGTASEKTTGAYQPAVNSNGAIMFRPEERAKMSVVMNNSGANTGAAPRQPAPTR